MQALLDMLTGFAAVGSSTGGGGASRQYVRPVLTEVGLEMLCFCSHHESPIHWGSANPRVQRLTVA